MLLRHVVVATDESEAGRSAVRAGLDLAERACARLTVMRAVPIASMPLLGSVVGVSSVPTGPRPPWSGSSAGSRPS
jgi:Universal stress protein family